jgi:hypothetical protein
MSNSLEIGIRRLEKALEFLREGDFYDWHDAYENAEKKIGEETPVGPAAEADEFQAGDDPLKGWGENIKDRYDWPAIQMLIVVATHGAPLKMSYWEYESELEIDELVKKSKDRT